MTNILSLQLRVTGAESKQKVKIGVASQICIVRMPRSGGRWFGPAVAEVVVAVRISEELLIFDVAVIAATELHGVLSVRDGEAEHLSIVKRGVLPRLRPRIECCSIRTEVHAGKPVQCIRR